MFKQRSPFLIPQIPGSTGRKRVGQRQQQQRRARQMSVQPPQKPIVEMKQTVPASTPSNLDQKFCFALKTPLQDQNQVYWVYGLTTQVSNEYARKLIFREQQYCVRGVDEAGIVETIFIVAENIPGYKGINGVQTHRVCALQLSQVQSILDDTDTRSYDLLYRQTQDVSWDIPMDLTSIRFKIQADDAYLSGQLGIPLTCQFDIRHMGR